MIENAIRFVPRRLILTSFAVLLVIGIVAIGVAIALLADADAARAIAALILHAAAGGG